MSRTLPRTFGALLLLALLPACAGSDPAPDDATHRTPPAGPVTGIAGRYGDHAWLGIPFAAPPQGELRWRAPQPAARWSETLPATRTGPPCAQLAHPFAKIPGAERGAPAGSEDCLRLDVWAPPFAPDEVPAGDARLPVMVWIHGGGNVIGHAGFYDGGRLATSEAVVVVAVQYRLGPLGWLRHASLRGPGTSARDRSGNYGTLDLVRALEWVRENIAAFGGDPGRVTVFGESAGGRNVVTLLVSPVARGLFQRAIVQSGGFRSAPPAWGEHFADAPEPGHVNSSNEVLARLLVADGRAPDDAAARALLRSMGPTAIAADLRARTPAELLAVYRSERQEGLADVPQIFRDGTVLPREALTERITRSDGVAPVPVMLGTNRDENKVFMAFQPEWAELRFGLVPQLRDPERFEITAGYRSRMWKATGADEPARALVAARGAGGPGVWVYRFDWDEEPRVPFLTDLSQVLGASHGFEIPFVFGHWYLGGQSRILFGFWNAEGREQLSEQMRSYWGAFAYEGTPGRGRTGELPEWAPWGRTPRFLVLDTPADGGLRLSDEGTSRAQILAEVARDPRLGTPDEKCRVYRELAASSGTPTRAEYESHSLGCAAYAWDDSPQP